MSNRKFDPRRPPGQCRPGVGRPVVLLGFTAAFLLARTGGVMAFPLLNSDNTDLVPQGTELASPDVQDLQHQLQLVNGLSAPAGGGWTFLPRVDWQEELTDNALQAHSPRNADLVSLLSPGIGIAGDLPRVTLTFDYAPTLSIYARDGDLNSLTQQMNGLASVTLVPELAYVDLRALAGVQSLYGGVGGVGTVGGGGATALPQAGIPQVAGNGLNRNNEVQTTSFGISPYLLHRFGDIGTGKLGYSLDVTKSNPLSGFASSPLPSGGANGQTLVTHEENAHFVSGDMLEFVQDTFDADLRQGTSTTGANGATLFDGLPAPASTSTSNRAIITDQLSYQINRDIAVFVSGGHEDITYSNQGPQSITSVLLTPNASGQLVPSAFNFANGGAPAIHDLTWSFGTTLTPNPDSSLTVSYGHQNGFNSLTADGHYTITPRTLLSVSYGSTLGSQLENVQNQLNQATANGTGGLANGLTGGQLFGTTNAFAVVDGVFRTTTLTVGTQTSLDRDIISLNLTLSKQTSANVNSSSTYNSKVASLSWVHQMRPDMTASATFSYAIQDQNSSAVSAGGLGNSTSMAGTLAWQWQLTDTLSTSIRYSFLERQSAVALYDIYENMLILGVTKRF